MCNPNPIPPIPILRRQHNVAAPISRHLDLLLTQNGTIEEANDLIMTVRPNASPILRLAYLLMYARAHARRTAPIIIESNL